MAMRTPPKWIFMKQAKAVQAVWRERAERLARRPVSVEAGQNIFPVLVLGIAKERYGVELGNVAEVLPLVRPTPVPGVAAVFAGVVNVHGEIRPVIDLRRYLGIEASIEPGIERMQKVRSNHLARVILLRQDGREMGLQIDSVEQIRWIAAGDLEVFGNCAAAGPQHIKGSTRDLLMLLSTEALFAELQPAQLEAGVTT
jgi:chemotaxis signal transduction protein